MEIDEIINRLENVVSKLTSYVYVLEEYDNGIYDLIGCYFTLEKVYEACNTIDNNISFNLINVKNLNNGDYIESKRSVKIHYFLIE